MEGLDLVFISCLQEIEALYRLNLTSKAQRLRVEKWIQKLINIGPNVTWRRDRNSYAKVLLNQIIQKQLSEPFHCLPKEGPLPSCPFNMKIDRTSSQVEPSYMSHETKFWKAVYSQMQQIDDVGVTSSINNRSYESLIGSEPKKQKQPAVTHSVKPLKHTQDSQENRELRALIREQDVRMKLLEQQLKDERKQYELSIQRAHYIHTEEVNRLKSLFDSTFNSSYDANDDLVQKELQSSWQPQQNCPPSLPVKNVEIDERGKDAQSIGSQTRPSTRRPGFFNSSRDESSLDVAWSDTLIGAAANNNKKF